MAEVRAGFHPSNSRRRFLRGAAASGVTLTFWLRCPGQVVAAESAQPATPLPGPAEIEAAFAATTADAARRALFETGMPTLNREAGMRLVIDAPVLAEDGSVVPVAVDAPALVRALYLLAPANPVPLVLALAFPQGAGRGFHTRIRLGGTATMQLFVATEAGWLFAEHAIEVARGGCVMQGAPAGV